MGLLTGGLSFRRYRIYGDLPSDFRETYLESILGLTHQENLKHRSKEPLLGWVSIMNPADIELDLNSVLYDHYLVLSLRQDKKAINSKLFSILLDRQYDLVKEGEGKERLAKSQKDEIKEALEEELLSQALPSVNVYDMAWDINTDSVLFFATSDSINDMFQAYFQDTFEKRLYAERMVDWLAEDMPWEEIEQRAINGLPGGSAGGGLAAEKNVDGWHEHDPLAGRELLLGTEFLTWLWSESEARDGHFTIKKPVKAKGLTQGNAITQRDADAVDLPEGFNREAFEANRQADDSEDEEITLWIDNKLLFKHIEEEMPGVTMMSGEAPSTTPEAKLTLVQGKRPVEARLGLSRGEYEWYFTLKALPGGLDIGGLKIPAEVKDGEDEKIYERTYLIEIVTSAVKTLFRQYYIERTEGRFSQGIEEWLSEE